MDNNEKEMKEVVLRDLEPVLQQKLGNQVIIENFTTKSLLPPGENYGSTILSVDVEYKNGQTGKKEELHLIAKLVPPTEYQRRIFNSDRTFKKEIFMYETILPAYNKLEIECGLKKNEIFEILPKFYGSRLSIQPDIEFDENAVFLMENLKIADYYTGDRSLGYDFKHSAEAVKALARFHALGMAMKQKKPGIFEVIKMHAKSWTIEGSPENMFNTILDKIKDDPEMNPYFPVCEKILKTVSLADIWVDYPREPWMTITHSDFWVNNILFHNDKAGHIDNVKFVDFQMYIYCSSVRDLIHFLFTSVTIETSDEEIEDLIDMYYEMLVNTLEKMKCDTSAFNKEDYKDKIVEDAKREFPHICFMSKLLTMDVKETSFNYDKIQDVLSGYAGSEIFGNRLRKIVLYFCKHNWL